MIVVFDVNVLIPLILDASRSTRIFRRLSMAGHRIVASPAMLDDVAEKLRTKESLRRWLDVSPEEIERFLQNLPPQLTLVPGAIVVQGAVPLDPDDDVIVAAAIESRAAYIVTEDRHLLDIAQWDAIKIVDRQTFAAILDDLGVP